MFKTTALGILLLFGVQARGAVWQEVPGRDWNKQRHEDFSRWISNKVGPKFFKELGGPYADLKLDCADALYGLKAYYSKIHGISFRIMGGRITNRNTRFDHIRDEDARLAAFISMVADSAGTENLAHEDTYSIRVKDVQPGDLYIYKYSTNGEEFTRHSYIIKNVNIDGTFDVLYSTQARRDKGSPLGRVKQEYLQHKPDNRGRDHRKWGFRRFKTDAYLKTDQSEIPGANFEQHAKAAQLSEEEFFEWVNSQTRSILESPQRKMDRHFSSVCHKLSDRAEVVVDAARYVQSVGGRCLNFREYDTYSTPSRDRGILSYYQKFETDYWQVADQARRTLDAETAYLVASLFARERSEQEKWDLSVKCRVPIPGRYRLNMGSFYDALADGQVSSHPNDNTDRRWGFATGRPTRCEAFY